MQKREKKKEKSGTISVTRMKQQKQRGQRNAMHSATGNVSGEILTVQ